MIAEDADGAAPTIDAFLGSRVTLVQPRKGHRAGLDAALLQAMVPPDAVGRAVDLGTGVGTVALSLAARCKFLVTVGVERDPALLQCARLSLARPENAGFATRVSFVQSDVAALADSGVSPILLNNSADCVLMNPPWDLPGTVRASPDAARRAAHVAESDTLIAWTTATAFLLRPGGYLCLIHRAAALGGALATLASRFGDIRIRPVHPFEGKPATRILIRATAGGEAPPETMPGLVLHQPGGAWTPEADALLRGEAHFPF